MTAQLDRWIDRMEAHSVGTSTVKGIHNDIMP